MEQIKKIQELSQNLKLLYVEDNASTREVMIITLKHVFNDIVVAVDGSHGLEKFKNNDIDMVITDINMPIMNGLEMSKAIKEINNQIPILIISAHSEINFFLDSINIGIDGYLLKPIQFKQILNVIEKTVKNIAYKREALEYRSKLEKTVEEKIQELREKDKLLMRQSKMASMGEMIDAIAHQWKQPLNAINMQADLIEMELEDGDFSVQSLKDAITLTRDQIDYLVETLSEFRQFFRPDNKIIAINIKELLKSIALLLKDELLKSTVSLNIICPDNIFIEANQNDIKHIFINLINNAKDEMNKADIANKSVIIECIQVETDVIIFVKDRGNGIPENIIDKIFQANFTTKQGEGGTGIGLYICKQIVDKYGGNIEAINGSEGAIFKVVLHAKITP